MVLILPSNPLAKQFKKTLLQLKKPPPQITQRDVVRFSKVMDPSEGISPLTELSSVLPNPKDELENLPISRKNPAASIPNNKEKSENIAKEPPQKKTKRSKPKWAVRFTPKQTPLPLSKYWKLKTTKRNHNCCNKT